MMIDETPQNKGTNPKMIDKGKEKVGGSWEKTKRKETVEINVDRAHEGNGLDMGKDHKLILGQNKGKLMASTETYPDMEKELQKCKEQDKEEETQKSGRDEISHKLEKKKKTKQA